MYLICLHLNQNPKIGFVLIEVFYKVYSLIEKFAFDKDQFFHLIVFLGLSVPQDHIINVLQ